MPKSNEKAWIRSQLTEWGIWRNIDASLPPAARLRTGGNDIHSSTESLELTNMAVLHLAKISFAHHLLIEWLYIPDSDGWVLSQTQIFDDKARLRKISPVGGKLINKPEISRMRDWAENKIQSFREGVKAAQEMAG